MFELVFHCTALSQSDWSNFLHVRTGLCACRSLDFLQCRIAWNDRFAFLYKLTSERLRVCFDFAVVRFVNGLCHFQPRFQGLSDERPWERGCVILSFF